MIVIYIVAFIAGIAGGAGGYFALRAAGFFQYLGGSKAGQLPTISKEALISRLLALNNPTEPYRIIRSEDTDLIAEWKVVDTSWHGVFNKSRLRGAYRMNLLVDAGRHSVRCYEEFGSVSWSAGTRGLIPSVRYRKGFFGGRVLCKKGYGKGYGIKNLPGPEAGRAHDYKFDINDIRRPVIAVVEESGWEWVPVTARRHATYKV